MKKPFSILLISVLFLTPALFAGVPNYDHSNNDFLESKTDIKQNVCLIKLTIAADGFVSLIVIDNTGNQLETLIDGELSKGEYNIYFKPCETIVPDKYTFILNVYSLEEHDLVSTTRNKPE